MDDRNAARDPGLANLQFARTLIDGLQAAGAAAAVICPGSRSTPLALAVAECASLPHSVHIDERSAAFYALGRAKATGRPVLLLCTSGTAAANFLPAIAEAHHARVPLVVLTADRPPELRAWGAAQTMEQRTLYTGFTRWSEEAPCPGEREGEAAYAAALARRAFGEATGPAPGPVHLNLPFREPLAPAIVEPGAPPAALHAQPVANPASGLGFDALATELRAAGRGVLLFGPDAPHPALAATAQALGAALGWPVIADPASGLRAGGPPDGGPLHGADLLLHDADLAAALHPELVIRCGAAPTSATLTRWLGLHGAADLWLVDPAGGYRDPQHRASRMLRATSQEFCAALAGRLASTPATDTAWLGRWRAADAAARAAASAALDAEDAFLTPHLARALWSSLPAGAALYAANSMAIRELDAYAGPRERPLRLFANRGVNGIDGLVSSALGAAAAWPAPTVLWCGDIALLHDVGGLLAASRLGADLTVVVSHDDGGGIFEYLPVARAIPRPQFESLFAVAHGTDLCALAQGCGWQATRAGSVGAFDAALARALGGGRHLIEVPVDRAANTAFHRRLHGAVREALRDGPRA